MSDLISRIKLLKEIETWGGCVEALHEYIENMPTAYDIDKVVEELEKELEVGNIAIDYGEFRLFEIVKQGGIYNDVCELKLNQF